MIIKITKSCSNGCKHCMNNNIPCNEHMDLNTFIDALNFTKKYDNDFFGNSLTGGEPTEHPQFIEFIDAYYQIFPLSTICGILTNGHWIINNPEKTNELLNKYPCLSFQVTYDSRYYPKKLDTTKRILRHKRVVLCPTVEAIYPQGRALVNNIPASSCYTTSKCTNLKLLNAQMLDSDLKEILLQLRKMNKHCTPMIHYNGGIGFGESDLCPTKCTIYDDEKYIRKQMLFNDCKQCPLQSKDPKINLVIEGGKEIWQLKEQN